MNNFFGVIIEESLEKKEVLKRIRIIKTKVEKITEKHKTPWVKQWTLHTVEIPEDKIETVSIDLSKSLNSIHNWYADSKNNKFHYIIFYNKIFKVDRFKKEQYDKVTRYGVSLGIPEYQFNFFPDIKEWKK